MQQFVSDVHSCHPDVCFGVKRPSKPWKSVALQLADEAVLSGSAARVIWTTALESRRRVGREQEKPREGFEGLGCSW
jgi:hypothetical protein